MPRTNLQAELKLGLLRLEFSARRAQETTQSQNSYELIDNAEAFFKDLIKEIDSAESTILLQFYDFRMCAAGWPLAQALSRAALRGVWVYVMVDSYIFLAEYDNYNVPPHFNREERQWLVQNRGESQLMFELMELADVEVVFTNPLGCWWQKAFWRDHKKLITIDHDMPERAVAYIGGINPTDWNAGWRDCMVKMRGDMITMLSADLNRTWNTNQTDSPNKFGVTDYNEGLILGDTHGVSTIMPAAIQLINRAREQVIIESPYLYGREIWRALTGAVQRGVEVTVIVPLHNHKRLGVPSRRVLAQAEAAGVQVYRYAADDGMTHARALIADNCGLFGSNAFSGLTAGRFHEIGIVTYNASLVAQLKQFLMDGIARSVQHGTR